MEMTRSDGEREDVFKEKTVRLLTPYFTFKQEVWSVDGNSRIDLVIINKENQSMIFGLEAKRYDSKRSNQIGEWLLQSIRYSLSEFDINGKIIKIPVVLAPPLSYHYIGIKDEKVIINEKEYFKDRHNQKSNHHTFNGIIGVFGLGELMRIIDTCAGYKIDYFTISFSNHEVWNNRNGNNNIKMQTYEAILRK